jgi:ribose 5-phosphate isomerase A
MSTSDLDTLKHAAAAKAVEFVKDGMVLGLGTGSTAKHLIMALGEKVKAGMNLSGISTSQETAMLARQCGIALIDAETCWTIDVAFDGADQVDPAFNLIKGGGAMKFVVMVDFTKRVPVLGGAFPLPVEVVPFGWRNTARKVEELTRSRVVLRERDGARFQTESGNLIVDVHLARIDRPDELETALHRIPGVVEAGLFVGRTDVLIVGTPDRTEIHHVKRG